MKQKTPLQVLIDNVKQLEEHSGLSRREIADAWGVSPSTLSLTLSGKRPVTGVLLERSGHMRIVKYVSKQ